MPERQGERLIGASILLVDDQQELTEDLMEILEDEGASVRCARTGAEGMKLATEGFDVALLDVQLPDTMGVHLLPQLRAASAGSEVMLITGHGSLDSAIEAVEAGAYAYVLKPFNPDELIASVERALRQARSTRAAEALRSSLARERDFISAVLDTAGALVMILDTEGRIIQLNAACERITGHLQEDQIGRYLWDELLPDGDLTWASEKLGERATYPHERELALRHCDGSERVVAWSNSVLVGAGETYLVWTGIDITERRHAERALLQAEKLSSIGQLSAGVAHEINNPLSGVMSCFKALRKGRVPAERQDEYLDTIEDGLVRIKQTVQGLLDYARLRTAMPALVDIGEVITASLRLVNPALHKKRQRVHCEISAGVICVRADRAQLMQALVNVLLNGSYAAPEDSTLEILPEEAEGLVGISVLDEGPGIPAEIRDKLCDPFFTTKPEGEGTGLGLSVTQGIITAHGGRIDLGSAPSGGACITLWLPGPVSPTL